MNNESLPLVSVITGYYNRKENLVNSIQSVLNQDYENFEYIIFDDCSTDGTRELIEKFEDPRLLFIKHPKNIGFTKGIIHAIAHAKGEFIAIHGAGDISYKERIKKQVEMLVHNPDLGIVGCFIEDLLFNGQEVEIVSPIPKLSDGNYNFSHGEVMYRKSLYYEAGGYNSLFRFGQFTMLKLEITKLSGAGCIQEVLYKRIHFANGVTKNDKRKIEQVVSYTLGKNISKYGLANVDVSAIVVAISLQNAEILKRNLTDKKNFFKQAKWRWPIPTLLVRLHLLGLVGSNLLRKYGSFIRVRNKIV